MFGRVIILSYKFSAERNSNALFASIADLNTLFVVLFIGYVF